MTTLVLDDRDFSRTALRDAIALSTLVGDIEENGIKEKERAVRKKIPRNDPCPCGSGKKYKRCHYLIDDA